MNFDVSSCKALSLRGKVIKQSIVYLKKKIKNISFSLSSLPFHTGGVSYSYYFPPPLPNHNHILIYYIRSYIYPNNSRPLPFWPTPSTGFL